MRLAWISSTTSRGEYSGYEANLLLPLLARSDDVVPLWIIYGGERPPERSRGVRTYPFPDDLSEPDLYFQTLVNQLKPEIIVTSLGVERLPMSFNALRNNCSIWIHRENPTEEHIGSLPGDVPVLWGEMPTSVHGNSKCHLPYLGNGADDKQAMNLTRVLTGLLDKFYRSQSSTIETQVDRDLPVFVMRQHLYGNVSFSYVMLELTDALLRLGIAATPQNEHWYCGWRELQSDSLAYQVTQTEKFHRVEAARSRLYDPASALTVHFSAIDSSTVCALHQSFPTLMGCEILYASTNNFLTRSRVRTLRKYFNAMLVPSGHVERILLNSGLTRDEIIKVPHAVDKECFRPDFAPRYTIASRPFVFLQSSFPRMFEKGFDLTIQAFCQEFSDKDDVVLLIHIPRLKRNGSSSALELLHEIIRNTRRRCHGPNIRVIEEHIPPGVRAGLYTSANCYVHPFRWETFGLTIIEAMACGIPVIATGWSGPMDYMKTDDCYILDFKKEVPRVGGSGRILGYHVEPDVDHLAYLMRSVYNSREEAKQFGSRASDRIRREWTWEHAAQGLVRGTEAHWKLQSSR